MAAHPRTPNRGLVALLHEAKWSRARLASAVNRAGAEAGLSLNYHQSAVSHWTTGTVPRVQVRPIIVEVLSRRLKRPVTHEEAGFPGPLGYPAAGCGGMVEQLMDGGRADMDPSRRGVVTAGLYSTGLAVPLFSDLTTRAQATVPVRTSRIGPGDVTTVRTMTGKVADILDELGGGHARPMAAAFLVNTVGRFLKASASENVRRDMLSAASDLVYLTGWMAMYEREHGLGQRYYHKALELAGAAGGPRHLLPDTAGDEPPGIQSGLGREGASPGGRGGRGRARGRSPAEGFPQRPAGARRVNDRGQAGCVRQAP